MKFHWEPEIFRMETEHNLFVTDTDESIEGHIVAFVRLRPGGDRWVCRFMHMMDDVYPDGQTYKNLKDAKAFTKRMAPALVIARITS